MGIRRYVNSERLETYREYVSCYNVDEYESLNPSLRFGKPVQYVSTADTYLTPAPINSRALFFNGGSMVQCGNNSVITTSTYTIEFWLYIVRAFKWGRVFVQGDAANASLQVAVCFYNWGLALYEGTATPISQVCLSSEPLVGQWVHVAFTKSSDPIYNVYINGIDYKTSIVSSTISSTGPLGFGAYNTGASAYAQFGLSDFRIWNTTRTQQQIIDNMLIPLSGDTTGITAYWKFDDGGTTIASKKPGGPAGTIYGPITTATTYGHFWYPQI